MIYGFEVTAAGVGKVAIHSMRKWRSTKTGYNSAAQWHDGKRSREVYEAPPGFKFSRRTYRALKSVQPHTAIEDYYRDLLVSQGKRIDGWLQDYKGAVEAVGA